MALVDCRKPGLVDMKSVMRGAEAHDDPAPVIDKAILLLKTHFNCLNLIDSSYLMVQPDKKCMIMYIDELYKRLGVH